MTHVQVSARGGSDTVGAFLEACGVAPPVGGEALPRESAISFANTMPLGGPEGGRAVGVLAALAPSSYRLAEVDCWGSTRPKEGALVRVRHVEGYDPLGLTPEGNILSVNVVEVVIEFSTDAGVPIKWFRGVHSLVKWSRLSWHGFAESGTREFRAPLEEVLGTPRTPLDDFGPLGVVVANANGMHRLQLMGTSPNCLKRMGWVRPAREGGSAFGGPLQNLWVGSLTYELERVL